MSSEEEHALRQYEEYIDQHVQEKDAVYPTGAMMAAYPVILREGFRQRLREAGFVV